MTRAKSLSDLQKALIPRGFFGPILTSALLLQPLREDNVGKERNVMNAMCQKLSGYRSISMQWVCCAQRSERRKREAVRNTENSSFQRMNHHSGQYFGSSLIKYYLYRLFSLLIQPCLSLDHAAIYIQTSSHPSEGYTFLMLENKLNLAGPPLLGFDRPTLSIYGDLLKSPILNLLSFQINIKKHKRGYFKHLPKQSTRDVCRAGNVFYADGSSKLRILTLL